MITQKELKELLQYNENTGIFTWKINKAKQIQIGSVAGYLHHTGYIFIKINNKNYLAHRLAWLFIYGKIPKMIDHINRQRNDNRINNLRETNYKDNRLNSADMDNYEHFITRCKYYQSIRRKVKA